MSIPRRWMYSSEVCVTLSSGSNQAPRVPATTAHVDKGESGCQSFGRYPLSYLESFFFGLFEKSNCIRSAASFYETLFFLVVCWIGVIHKMMMRRTRTRTSRLPGRTRTSCLYVAAVVCVEAGSRAHSSCSAAAGNSNPGSVSVSEFAGAGFMLTHESAQPITLRLR